MTSPPFFATTEFVRHNWLRLWLLGWSLRRQKEEAQAFVGEKNLKRFEQDLGRVVQECAGLLGSEGYLVIHGGSDNGKDLVELCRHAIDRISGFDVRALFEENADIARKHALRKHSGARHKFLVAQRL